MKKTVKELVSYLASNKLTLSLAESITCGLASHQMNTVKGTSEVFMGSIVCYHESIKSTVLKVSPARIKKYTAESQEVTDELAKKLKNLFDTDVHAAITGLATTGASETRTKPVGTVFFAMMYKRKLWQHQQRFYGSPLQIKRKACEALFNFIFQSMKAADGVKR